MALVQQRRALDKGRMRSAASFLRSICDFALPPRCPGCGTVVDGDHRFCISCWQQMEFLGGGGCAACGVPLPPTAMAGIHCGPCLASPPDHDGVRAAVVYGEMARRVVLKLKYGRRPGMAHIIAGQLGRFVVAEEADGPSGLLVPVPLHRWRLWSRGYNQSMLIARLVSRQTGVSLAPALLKRTRATPSLRNLGAKARAKAVRGAFRVAADARANITGRTIWLIDDVYTSGATANACARALKRAGAKRVILLCWARVLQSDVDNGGAEPHLAGKG
ncbi:ComF family protein [Sphingomonas sp. C3-2]|uniref:ComF family protein n=1 Tax=Sphingomonas sp. C3-2 TaxID=3062169 RepID=UPI00294AA617|nr:ComF family protein [Sphingomonas sp. C3-2]